MRREQRTHTSFTCKIRMVETITLRQHCFRDIRYNGKLDTCAYFNFRGMSSGVLSRNWSSCLFDHVESAILLYRRSKPFVLYDLRLLFLRQAGLLVKDNAECLMSGFISGI